MSLASFDDVKALFFGDLSEADRGMVERRLVQAENKIRSRIPELDVRADSDPRFRQTVIDVSVDAVIRLLNNPEGFIQEVDGNYQYQREASAGAGRITILPEEWRDLGVRRKTAVIHSGPSPLVGGGFGSAG